MTKIYRVEDLPEWFDLKEYEGCKSFGAIQWHLELSRRADTFEQISTGREIKFTENNETPESCKENTRKAAKQYLNPIRPLLTGELMGASYNYKGEERPATNWLYAESSEDGSLPINELGYLMSREIKINKRPILRVDLDATDDVLIQAFASWLKEARAQKQFAPRRKRKLYSQWERYGLLPYLDLCIWARITGHKISDEVMAEAITPGRSVDNLRTTTKKIAKELMGNLSEIAALAAIESKTSKG